MNGTVRSRVLAALLWTGVLAAATLVLLLGRSRLDKAHVALTPGRDFGPAAAERYVRLSFANSMPELQEALARLARELPRL